MLLNCKYVIAPYRCDTPTTYSEPTVEVRKDKKQETKQSPKKK